MPVLAIDGRAGSGKSSLANQLAALLPASVIHLDDFFLPVELRSPERLAEPGGNFHYERFRTEVLPCLRQAEPFSYRKFDCGRMDYGEEVEIPSAPWLIVEGAYSLSRQLDLSLASLNSALTNMAAALFGPGPTWSASSGQAESLAWPPLDDKIGQGDFLTTLKGLIQAQAQKPKKPEVYYNCAIFCDIDPEVQRQRILDRNGPDQAEDFFQRWIPLEEAYIRGQNPQDRAHIIIHHA